MYFCKYVKTVKFLHYKHTFKKSESFELMITFKIICLSYAWFKPRINLDVTYQNGISKTGTYQGTIGYLTYFLLVLEFFHHTF